MEPKEPIKAIHERLEKLEKDGKKKDIWDIVSILSSFLIPLSIFFAGFFLSEADRKAQIENKEKEIQIADIKSKVDQAQLVSQFLDALVDTNSYKRRLAIKSVLLALPEKGPDLVDQISENDPNEEIKTYAKEALENSGYYKRAELIENIFSPEKSVRLQTTEKLTTKWTNDAALIPDLLDVASTKFGEEPNNMSGIINTIVVLNRMNSALLEQHRNSIIDFIQQVEALEGRSQTQTALKTLKERMQ